jgi:hypothetical protein
MEKTMKTDRNDEVPLSSLVGERGIKTSRDFADFMGALMADLVAGRVDYQDAQAACLAGEQLLKVSKMQLDYMGGSQRKLVLGGEEAKPLPPKELTEPSKEDI